MPHKTKTKAEMSKGTVEHFLMEREGLSHLKVRPRGDLLTLESVDEFENIYPHARFRKKSPHKWSLEMPVKNGWETTFIEGTLVDLMETLVKQFPWILTSR